MAEISLTTFVDFVISSGTPRITAVRDAKAQYLAGYDPAKDFYRQIRNRIISMHEGGHNKAYINDVLDGISPRKLDSYTKCIKGYKRWLGRKNIIWSGRVYRDWTVGDLTVRINPELGLTINETPYIIKLYFKSEALSKRRVETILHLIKTSFPKNYNRSRVGVLDIQNSRLIEPAGEIANIDALLRGEALAFSTMWNEIHE